MSNVQGEVYQHFQVQFYLHSPFHPFPSPPTFIPHPPSSHLPRPPRLVPFPCLKRLATVRSTELAGILKSQDKKRRNVSRGGKDVNVKVPRYDVGTTPAPGLAPPLVRTMDVETKESQSELSGSYPCLTSYNLHARTSSGVGVVSTLTPFVLYLTVPEEMGDSTFAVYSVANTLPETYNRVTPRIKKITSTQFSIAVKLTDLTVKTKAMYKIDVHIQGISQSTEWFQTITKLDKIRDPHFHGALILASLGSSN